MATKTREELEERVPAPIRVPGQSKTDKKNNTSPPSEILLDINHRGKVMRSGAKVKKMFSLSFDNRTSNYHFANEIKMMTHFQNKDLDICPSIHRTEYHKDELVIVMDYGGIDLCQLYHYCLSNTGYRDPFTGSYYRFDLEWWYANIGDICMQIKKIMKVMREENVVHLDIKPENFVFDMQSHKVKIIDFSNSYFSTDPKVKERDLRMYSIGTTAYMSPEAVLEGDRSYAVDLWAVAMTLYVLQTGSHIPGSSLIMNDIKFDITGTVLDKPRFRSAFAAILMHAKPIIEKDHAYNENISSLATYFTKKAERPTEFLAP